MFKKPVKVSAQNQLSGKDRKTVKNKLATQFDEATLETLFNKNDKIVCNKISGSKMLIYMTEQYPLFVDGTGKEDFFPSVYTCAAYEPLSRSIIINEGVQTFIYNGANLMWPGVYSFSGLGNFKKDEVVSIRNIIGEVIAIGALGCSLDELKQNPDGSGIAAYILHFKGDRLWDMGLKQYPEIVVKAKQVKVEEKKQQPTVETKQVKKEEQQSEQEEKPKPKGKQKKQEPKKQQKKDKNKKKEASESQQEEKPKAKGKEKKQQPKKDDKKKDNKKNKKQESESEQQEEKPQPKGKNNKDKLVETKPAAKKEKQPEPESDDEDLDFGGFVHTTKKERPQIQMEKKKVAVKFSDDEDDKKGKKKPQKKGAKRAQSDEQQQPVQVQPNPPKKQKHQQDSEQQQDNKKNKGKKGKGKKQKEESEQQEQKPEPKKQVKKKQGKKEKKEQSDEQNEDNEEKGEKQDQEKQQKEGKSAISGQLMDQHFKEAFLNVLKLTKAQAELPIDSGRFFSDYMVLARPEGVKLEIKDTTYKKLGKFYEEMAKEKLIEFKPAKEKKGQQGSTITKIFWQNEQLKNFFPTIKRMREKQVEQKEQVYSKQKLKLSKTVQVDYVYKLSDELKQILYKKIVNYMPSVEQEEAMAKQEDVSKKDVFLNEKQLKEKIEKYINDIVVKDSKQAKEQKEGKEKKADKLITLSYKDNHLIHDLLKSEIEQYEENLQKEEMMAHHSDQEEKREEKKAAKKDKHKKNLFRIERGYLVNKIMKLAHSYYNISDKQTGLNKFKEGTFKGIQLIADKVVNKNVTKIIGLQNFIPSTVHEDEVVKQIHGFSHTLQVKFASSSNVQNLPGKNAGREIVVQGNFVDELQSLLMSEYGIKKEYITIQNKLGKKKKN